MRHVRPVVRIDVEGDCASRGAFADTDVAEGDHSFIDAFLCQRDTVVGILAFDRRVVGSCTARFAAGRPDFHRIFP